VALKAAGYDAIAITGKASAPSVLTIIEGNVAVVSAEAVWGKDTYDTFDILTQKYGSKAALVCIGPAGEQLIPMANIMSEGAHARAAGRCGLGAVMGSKRLKAVVADGTLCTPVARPKELMQDIRDIVPLMLEKMKRMRSYGTPGAVVGNAVLADLSAYNWTNGNCGKAVECLSGEVMQKGVRRREIPLSTLRDRLRQGSPGSKRTECWKNAPLEYETIGGSVRNAESLTSTSLLRPTTFATGSVWTRYPSAAGSRLCSKRSARESSTIRHREPSWSGEMERRLYRSSTRLLPAKAWDL